MPDSPPMGKAARVAAFLLGAFAAAGLLGAILYDKYAPWPSPMIPPEAVPDDPWAD